MAKFTENARTCDWLCSLGCVCLLQAFGRYNPFALQEWLQRFRYNNAAVCLLVVLNDCDPRAANRQTTRVERMNEVGLGLPALETNLCSPRLKRLEVRAGRNLFIAVLPR